jgi:hypothetical protein
MRVITICLDGDEDNVDRNNLDESKEALEYRSRKEMERLERIVTQEELEIAYDDTLPDDLLSIIDDQLAEFGLEIVQFLYKSKEFHYNPDDCIWRIEKRRC